MSEMSELKKLTQRQKNGENTHGERETEQGSSVETSSSESRLDSLILLRFHKVLIFFSEHYFPFHMSYLNRLIFLQLRVFSGKNLYEVHVYFCFLLISVIMYPPKNEQNIICLKRPGKENQSVSQRGFANKSSVIFCLISRLRIFSLLHCILPK